MDYSSKNLMAAFAGWLLVQISGNIDATLSYFLGDLGGLPRFIGIFVALVGWIITIIFSYEVIKDAFKNTGKN